MENKNENVIIIYKSYSQAQKKANLKYKANNKEKCNQLAKKYYDKKKDDPEYIQKKRESAKKYYLKRKELLLKANLNDMLAFLEKKME
jgi:putative sterol carrier protein